MARRAIEAISQAADVGADLRIFVNASVGISFADHYDDVDAVMRDADVAMYLAKRRGKGRYEVFETGMRQQVLERLELRVELVDALDRGELALRYQPVVDLETVAFATSKPSALEPSGAGEFQPAHFISIAEEADLLAPIGRWVLEESCRRAQTWDPSPDGPDLGEREPQATRRRLVRHRRAPRPRPQSPDPQPSCSSRSPTRRRSTTTTTSASVLRTLRDMGMRVALDDFGVRHVARTAPATGGRREVRSELRHVEPGRRLERVAGCHRFAHDLGLDTVGKGIENADQLAQLGAIGCRYAQGT